jgi:hypothetical protein
MSGRHGHISGREMAVHGVCLMIWNTFAGNWNRPFNRVDLGEDEVHVWLAPLDQDAAALQPVGEVFVRLLRMPVVRRRLDTTSWILRAIPGRNREGGAQGRVQTPTDNGIPAIRSI